MKQLCKYLLMLSILLVFNCVEDDIVNAPVTIKHNQHPNFKIESKSFDDLKSDFKFNNAVNKVLPNYNKNSKTVMEDEYGFTIDSTKINTLTISGTTTYTFLIHRDVYDASFFENLVVKIDSTNIPKAYIIKHTLNSEIDFIEAHDSFILDADIQVTSIDYNDTQLKQISTYVGPDGCTVFTLMCPWQGVHPATQNCLDEERNDYYWEQDSSSCPSDLNGSDPGGLGGGAVEAGGGGNGPGIPYAPNYFKQPWEHVVDCFLQGSYIGGPSLSSQQIAWLQTNKAMAGAVSNFLSQNNSTPEALNFADQALQALIADGEVDFIEKIIFNNNFKNNIRLKCIYNKIKSGDNTISNYLTNFLGEQPVAHLKLSADNSFNNNYPDSADSGAITLSPQNYIIEIVFNTDATSDASAQNFPTIILAGDMLHEILHAELYRKLLSVAQVPSLNLTAEFIHSIKNDFPSLNYYYTRYIYNVPPGQQPTSAQHALMAENYRGMIIDALREFDNNAHSDFFYEALSWSGLTSTPAWQNLSQGMRTQLENEFNNAVQNETHDCN